MNNKRQQAFTLWQMGYDDDYICHELNISLRNLMPWLSCFETYGTAYPPKNALLK